MGIDIENELNKIRWERWRVKQKSEREKTYFYCWSEWSDLQCSDCDSNGTEIKIEATLDPENWVMGVDWKQYCYCCAYQVCLVIGGTVKIRIAYENPDGPGPSKTHDLNECYESGKDIFNVEQRVRYWVHGYQDVTFRCMDENKNQVHEGYKHAFCLIVP